MLTLNPDGTATVTYRDKSFTLYEPTLAQMAELTDLLDEVRPKILGYRDQIEALRSKIDEKMPEGAAEEQLLEAKRLHAELRRTSSSMMVRAVELLAYDEEAAEMFAADPPVKAAQLVEFQRLLLHFHNVPFDGRVATPD